MSEHTAGGTSTDASSLVGQSEDALLAGLFGMLPSGPGVRVGPGDDAAVLATGPLTLVTTDAMVRGRDWRDEWSTARDVGSKVVAANLSDVAAMGGVPTALVVTLLADPATPRSWVHDLTLGIAEACRAAGVAVVGGDLSSAPAGFLAVSLTALGDQGNASVVLRSGARPGDVVALAGTLGRSAAGLLLLQAGTPDLAPDLVAYHLRPDPPWPQGPVAARAGAHAMLDLSDGLVRDGGRLARASSVRVELSGDALAPFVGALRPAVGDRARACVLGGGEEHSLLACFGPEGELPAGWAAIGAVRTGTGIGLDGVDLPPMGWDHFQS